METQVGWDKDLPKSSENWLIECMLFPPLLNQNAYICVELYDVYTYIWNNLKSHLGILQTKDWQTMTCEANPVTLICLSNIYDFLML